MQINTKAEFEIRGARGIGKTHLITTVVVPALEAAGYKVERVGAERWSIEMNKDGTLMIDVPEYNDMYRIRP